MSDLDMLSSMEADSWGDRVRRLREAEGLSMDQLAARCTPPTTGSEISKLEKGRLRMTEAWVRRIADALGVHALGIIEPAAQVLEPRERKLLELHRGMSERDRDTVFRVADALPKSPASAPVRRRRRG